MAKSNDEGLQTREREIGQLLVTTTQLPPMRAFLMSARLARLVMPALGKLDGLNLSSLLRQDLANLGPAIADVFARLTDDDAQQLLREILVATSVRPIGGGKSIELTSDAAINKAFAGAFGALFATARFALEVNYADFFGDGSPEPDSDAPKPNPVASP